MMTAACRRTASSVAVSAGASWAINEVAEATRRRRLRYLAAFIMKVPGLKKAYGPVPCLRLSSPERKSGDVFGEEFAGRARREQRAYPASPSVRSEQRRLGRKEAPP